MNKQLKLSTLLPVLLAFFVMSFADLVGTAVDELKQSVNTPRYLLQLIPFATLIWYFLLSVPVGLWQDRIGEKKMLTIGLFINVLGLLVPVFGNTLTVIMLAFTLLGIGNTIVQVSANPLLVNIVPEDRSSSLLSLSQFIKSLGSMAGPFVAAVTGPWLAGLFGDTSEGAWRYGLYLYGFIAFISWVWLSSVKVDENHTAKKKATFSSCFKLLNNKLVLMMVMGIFLVVGIDVAMNSNIGNYLEAKIGLDTETAKYGKTMYFFAKMTGTFAGAIILTKFASRSFLIGSSILSIVAMFGLIVIPGEMAAWVIIFIISLGVSNIFPLIFSITVGKMPERANEISGLMMMAISGGAVIPFFVGWAMEVWLPGGILVLIGCAVYLLLVSLSPNTK